MNKKKLEKVALFFFALHLMVSPVWAAKVDVRIVDEAGHIIGRETLTGQDQEIVMVREKLAKIGVTGILAVSQESAVARDRDQEEVIVTVGGGTWNPRWYPLDYESKLRWQTAWQDGFFPSYREASYFFQYDRQRYADYVRHYEALRQYGNVTEERTQWVKDGQVEKTTVYPRYIVGVKNTNFEGDRSLTRAEAATMFARLVAGDEPIEVKASSYADVKPENWYYHTVNFAAQRGLVIAKAGEPFRPNDPISTADFMELLRTSSSILGTSGVSTLLSGEQVSRKEAVVAINRTTGRTPDHEYIRAKVKSPFADVLADDPFYDELMTAASTHMESVWTDGIYGWSFHTP